MYDYRNTKPGNLKWMLYLFHHENAMHRDNRLIFVLIMTTFTEENYLKAIFKLSSGSDNLVSTNALADELNTRAPSVTDMIKKLCEKKYLTYVPYQGVKLAPDGKTKALQIIRKHRIWEVFLVERLGMGWDEVHEIAEQLEHTNSEKLYESLDRYLNYPKFDPHGDPIPDKRGNMENPSDNTLFDAIEGCRAIVTGVSNHLPEFLQFLNLLEISPGVEIQVTKKYGFDGSMGIKIAEKQREHLISQQVARSILVKF